MDKKEGRRPHRAPPGKFCAKLAAAAAIVILAAVVVAQQEKDDDEKDPVAVTLAKQPADTHVYCPPSYGVFL